MERPDKLLTIVLGPTAVGKTSYAISLAKEIGSPIVNCDSRQIYREMSIGTALPTHRQLREVKHYLIQNHSITEHYTAGLYELEALELLGKLFKSHDHIVMCGGSGMYIDALCRGLDDFPKADLKLREELSRRLTEEGLSALQAELKERDSASYESIDISNPQRVIRALEVTIQTGRRFSDWKSGDGSMPQKRRDFSIEKIGLTRERGELYDRINKRVEVMMEAGLLEEVRSLNHYRYKEGVLRRDLLHVPALRSVGYRELFDYIDGLTDLPTAIELIKRNSRHYAKRQLTYWARDNSIRWIKL